MSISKDRVIVIIGASSGCGQALVRQLAGAGVNLVLTTRNADSLLPLKQEAEKLGAASVSLTSLDILDETAVQTFFEGVKAAHGQADDLVYLPGLSIPAPITQMNVEDYETTFNVNLKGLFLVAKHFVPATRPERNPLFSFISSQAANRANPNAPLYCTAKAAVSMFGQGLALQVIEQNVRVTSFKPGAVATDAFWGERKVPKEKFLKPEDVADVITFVLGLPQHIVMHEVSFESFTFLKK